MSILLQNLRIATPSSSKETNEKVDILIEDGIISSLQGKQAADVFDLDGCYVSPGWMDFNANFCDPGDEIHEDISTGSAAAIAGGFTDVQLSPQTHPTVDTKSAVAYLLKHSVDGLRIHPTGAISSGLRGEELTEIRDLFDAGALSFSNGDEPIWNSELLLKALQYTQSISAPIIQNARDLNLIRDAHMHEGSKSTELGLRGEPSLSEYLVMRRDIEILKYSGGNLHFSCVSTAEGVQLVKEAKDQGLHVTASVGIHHLLFTEESVAEFDTNFKVLPPYRSESDRLALIEGVKAGVIDVICSNHRPYSSEYKQLEFDLASFGNISLQTFYPALLKVTSEIPLRNLLKCVIESPREILGLQVPRIEVGEPAQFSLFDPEKSWRLDDLSNLSKSNNSPFWGQDLLGKVVGTVNGKFHRIES